MLLACLAGLVAGALHVFAGPDHLAALAPLSLRARRRAWSVGLRWGLGHSAGVLAVGAAAFLLRTRLDFDAFSAWGERIVGATLIGLGLWGLRSLFRERLHAHAHAHDGREHVHFHVHRPGAEHGSPAAHVHAHAAFWIGILHGLAGTGHLVGILPSLTLPSGRETAGYLAAFAGGTVLAMVLFAAAIGWAAPGRTERGLRIYRFALGGASILCALVGAAWLLFPFLGLPLA